VTRRYARELALQSLFAIEVGHHDAEAVLGELEERTATSEDRRFIKELVLGTLAYAHEADERIAPLLQGWTLERLPTVDRIVLRMALFEMLHDPETPRPVVLNEAVELAKKFSTEDSGRFVNGVLASAVAAA